MPMVETFKAQKTLRYWEASLAWKNVDDWSRGWTVESFTDECRMLCCDQGRIGYLADILLDDMINDRERTPLKEPGQLIPLVVIDSLSSLTQIIGQSN